MKTSEIEGKFKLAEDYEAEATAPNTRIAYRKDIDRFISWGGVIPASVDQVCAYMAEHASSHKPTTISRWIASISQAHKIAKFDSPTADIQVKRTLAGIKNEYDGGIRSVQPLTDNQIRHIINILPKEDLTSKRDKAIILIGFSAALRRSDIVKLKMADLRNMPEGIRVDLRKTKTDQEGKFGARGIPYAENKNYCPVLALNDWLSCANIKSGHIFRPISKSGVVGKNGLSSQSIASIVKKLALLAGYNFSEFSGHSLRSGLATSAARAKKSRDKIRAITGHKSDYMLDKYIRDGEIFNDNAAKLF